MPILPAPPIAVLLSTHFVSDLVLNKYRRLVTELDSSVYDVTLLVNKEESFSQDGVPQEVKCFCTCSESLDALLYHPIAKTLLPGSCHFPLMRFFLDYPTYLHYWFIEYDVEFTGRWAVLMDDCHRNLADYDFLSCHVEHYSKKNHSWPWWHLDNRLGVPLSDSLKSFNPICRCSNSALHILDQYQKAGHSAHEELIMATCFYTHGMKIGDLGGDGAFVPEGYMNKFYLDAPNEINGGTMRYRPVYSQEEVQNFCLANTLFHPIKSERDNQ